MNMAHAGRNWWLAFFVSCAVAFFQCERKSTVLTQFLDPSREFADKNNQIIEKILMIYITKPRSPVCIDNSIVYWVGSIRIRCSKAVKHLQSNKCFILPMTKKGWSKFFLSLCQGGQSLIRPMHATARKFWNVPKRLGILFVLYKLNRKFGIIWKNTHSLNNAWVCITYRAVLQHQ